MSQMRCNMGTFEVSDSGAVDYNAVRVFTRGHCHSFALALHKLTGWPMFGIGCTPNSPSHCVVYCPQLDEYIDIEGAGVKERWADQFERQFCALEAGQIPDLIGYREPDVESALPFAKTVLQSLPIATSEPAHVTKDLLTI